MLNRTSAMMVNLIVINLVSTNLARTKLLITAIDGKSKLWRKVLHTFVMLFSTLVLFACTQTPIEGPSPANRENTSNTEKQAGGSQVNQAKNDMDIYLLIGQSNMAGRAPIPEEHKAPLKGVFVLNNDGEWVVAKHPLNLYSTIRKSVDMQKAGPGINFAKYMKTTQPNQKIGLLVNARGGSTIAQWCDICDYYEQVLTRVEAIKNKESIKGIL